MKACKATFSLALAVLFLAGFQISAAAVSGEAENGAGAAPQSGGTAETADYENYLQLYPDGAAAGEWPFGAESIQRASDGLNTKGTAGGRSPVCLFEQNDTFAEWSVEVPSAGYYELAVEYLGLPGKQSDIELALLINGAQPFRSAYRFLLSRRYKDAGSITQDGRGNDVRPVKQEAYEWTRRALQDKDGIYSTPYRFYFHAGKNSVRLEMIQAGVAVARVILSAAAAPADYEAYDSANRADPDKADTVGAQETILIEAETPFYVSHTQLAPTYDRMSAATSPNSPAKLRLNTIGQSNWKMPGQAVTWKFNVEKAGYYTVHLRARQNLVRGFFSSRNLYIDDRIPFREMINVRVDYDKDWQIKTLGGDQPYEFYFSEGSHTLTLEAVGGEIGVFVQTFESIILDLNQLYREMIMVTGATPDPYRDYKLEREIPGLQDQMRELAQRLRDAKAELEEYNIQRGNNSVMAERLAQQLDSFIKKPRSVPERLASFQSNISALSGWVLSLKEQPLELDYILIQSPEKAVPAAEAGFAAQAVFRVRSFLSSFTEDYSVIADETGVQDALKVWISLGRDQAQIVKDLTENEFTPQTGIPVDLSLVQQGLIEAIAAGKGPDIMLYCGINDPVNLAARNQLVDLSRLDGFDGIQSQYAENAMQPYIYNGGVYALPLQQNFPMLFCRTDILSDLGVSVPKTWDEFYDVTMKILKRKLMVGIPAGSVTAPDSSMFDTLLYQNNGRYYNAGRSATEFDGEAALAAFRQWTDFYKKYNLPIEFNFYVRFRSGEMPMAIQNYTMYNQLAVAAPEIRGLWSMNVVPGTKMPDGTVNHTVSAGGTGCLMLRKTKDPDQGFRFMSWFASAPVQVEYGLSVESVLGQGARYDPANTEALGRMNWDPRQLRLLEEQMEKTVLTPQLPVSYIVTRDLTYAFRAVVIKGQVPRDALYTYNQDINREIKRKQEELGWR